MPRLGPPANESYAQKKTPSNCLPVTHSLAFNYWLFRWFLRLSPPFGKPLTRALPPFLRPRVLYYYLSMDTKLLELLVCPVTKGPLEYNREKQELISRSARLAYPVRDGLPVMLENEARTLTDVELGL